jgi:hypothetical protein
VQHFTDHIFSRDLVGNMILIALWSLQVESGCGFHLLEHPDEWVPYITPCLLMSIHDFISWNKIMIKVESTHLIPASQQARTRLPYYGCHPIAGFVWKQATVWH